MKTYLRTLTIAGSDSSGGAGIQADLKTFSALGCYGMTVITALTAQNTQGVHGIYEVAPAFVRAQLDAVVEDIGVDAVKIGMLHDPDIIRAVAGGLRAHGITRVVLDPVMVAQSGGRLIKDEAVEALKTHLIPRATMITPNLPEAQVLLGRPIERQEDVEAAARALLDLGPASVLVKGGHLGGTESVDCLLVSERLVREDTFTSIHIEEYEVEIRETKLGKEEFTRDIPNVGEKALGNLDESGIVRVGTPVEAGDILVGKVAPKSKSELTPEEKLLHAIFGRAGVDVKNASLTMPPGTRGVVIDAQKFSRRVNLTDSERQLVLTQIRDAERDFLKAFRDLTEEMLEETQKILGDDSIRVNATTVRVPVFYGHSEAVHIETRQKISSAAARDLLMKAPGVKVVDERSAGLRGLVFGQPGRHTIHLRDVVGAGLLIAFSPSFDLPLHVALRTAQRAQPGRLVIDRV